LHHAPHHVTVSTTTPPLPPPPSICPQVRKTLANYTGVYSTGTITAGHVAFNAALNILVRLQADCLDHDEALKARYTEIEANEGVAAVNAANPYPYFKRQTDEA
jgi:hypothetical protein